MSEVRKQGTRAVGEVFHVYVCEYGMHVRMRARVLIAMAHAQRM